ncbi:hypothetical protein FRC07_012304 [Ceratobasidium sp. 392]|nr:hypothetical protein FRC07_012304 [Ceratobasidium sp. 392]
MAVYATLNDTSLVLYQLRGEKILNDFWHKYSLETLRTDDGSESGELPPAERIAVIGAGVSGLQVAMKLGTKYKVDVFEASDRVGGRLYTYHFNQVPGAGEWDYFDVGAMRFPDTSVMAPTYKLFKELGIPLLDYHMSCGDTRMYYNNRHFKRSDATGQDFGASISEKGNVPDAWAAIGYAELMKIACRRFVDALKENYDDGYEQLMVYDEYSTRAFMAFVKLDEYTNPKTGVTYLEKPLYPTTVINWLETMSFSSGWFDRAFSETILELLAFADGNSQTQWRCVKGGSDVITTTMLKRLQNDPNYKDNVKIHLCHQAATVEYDLGSKKFNISGKYRPSEKLKGFEAFSKSGYSQAMRYMDLSSCRLDYAQRSALLMLQPGPSTKVGMKFKSNWWAKQGIIGGQSTTDLPVRTVVYPSYGDGKSTVLIASYCWTQDANAMGALMQGKDSFDEVRLKNVILRDLAEIHKISLEELEDEFEAMYAYDWNHNPRTMGAYAFFGPGEFTSLYPNLTRPAAEGRLHFAGEAISTCHAWVAGALDSANRVVTQIDPEILLPAQATPGGIPHGSVGQAKSYPTLLGRDTILKQVLVSSYLQGKEFNQRVA